MRVKISISFPIRKTNVYIKTLYLTLASVAQLTERGLQTKASPVRFPVRTHAWVAGQDPSGGHVRGNHTFLLLSFSFSLPSPLSINKQTKSF